MHGPGPTEVPVEGRQCTIGLASNIELPEWEPGASSRPVGAEKLTSPAFRVHGRAACAELMREGTGTHHVIRTQDMGCKANPPLTPDGQCRHQFSIWSHNLLRQWLFRARGGADASHARLA
jgi:hypothetical protein